MTIPGQLRQNIDKCCKPSPTTQTTRVRRKKHPWATHVPLNRSARLLFQNVFKQEIIGGLSGVRWQGEPGACQFDPLHSHRSSRRTVTGRMVVKVDTGPPGGTKPPQTRPDTLGTGVERCPRRPSHSTITKVCLLVRYGRYPVHVSRTVGTPFSNAFKRVLVTTRRVLREIPLCLSRVFTTGLRFGC